MICKGNLICKGKGNLISKGKGNMICKGKDTRVICGMDKGKDKRVIYGMDKGASGSSSTLSIASICAPSLLLDTQLSGTQPALT